MIPHSCSTSSTSAASGGLQHILTLELAVPDLHDAILQSGKGALELWQTIGQESLLQDAGKWNLQGTAIRATSAAAVSVSFNMGFRVIRLLQAFIAALLELKFLC